MRIVLFLWLFLGLTPAFCQDLKPGETEALLTLYFSTPKNEPLQEEVTLKAKNSGKEFKGTPDAQGKWQLLVPTGDTYSVFFKNGQKQDEFAIAKRPYYSVSKRIIFAGSQAGVLVPSLNQALIKFQYTDLDDKPLDGEVLSVKSLTTGKSYTATTKGTEVAMLLVPIGDKYSLTVAYDTNYRQIELPQKPNLYTFNIKYKSIGTKAWKARLEEKAKRLAEREAAWKAGTWNLPQRDTVVSSVFRRNFGGNKKLIVTDVTGSMYPYVSQVLHWYELNYAQAGTNQFVMFNDGDNTPDDKKLIGRTGGIYYCKYCQPKDLIQTMRKAMNAGNGGDGPENNLEALLKGIRQADPFDRVIMIADNYADVKDLILLNHLKKLNVPIHIILCGVDQDINEDYLNVAYQTGGAVYTMENDIASLTKTVEGEKVKIGNNYYMLQNGRFFLYKK